MSDQTKINPNVRATEINREVQNKTAVNNELLSSPAEVAMGTVLSEKYEILSALNVSTGEADLYICKCDGKEYVAKIYRRKRAIKPEVIRMLKGIDSPFVAKLYDSGDYNGFPYEILPYYRNGSLQGKRYSLAELKKSIIPCINEALRVLHQNGIIHKDLKPSNIMLLDNKSGVAIIDFGISSVTENGNTVLVTKTGMTPEYSAPETFKSLFLEESDYYSFGITLYELFCGNTPYKNMSGEEIARYTAVQRIPFPQDMPQELQDLIAAVTYFDITNRRSKENPNRRWTYDEVKNWCNGIAQPIPGEGVEAAPEKAIPNYPFLGSGYKEISSLMAAFGKNWAEGKKQLFRGLATGFFKNFNPEIAGYCMDAEEDAGKPYADDDLIFWEFLYRVSPELQGFYWCGRAFASLPALGREMLKKLWNRDRSDEDFWNDLLGKKLLSRYLTATKAQNPALSSAVSALETSYALENKSERDRLKEYYTMAYLLSGQKILFVDGRQIKNVPELTAYMKTLFDSSFEKFEAFCNKMIDADDNLDVQLETWLIAVGKRQELGNWKKELQK